MKFAMRVIFMRFMLYGYSCARKMYRVIPERPELMVFTRTEEVHYIRTGCTRCTGRGSISHEAVANKYPKSECLGNS